MRVAALLPALLAAVAVAGCGGGDRQAAKAKAGVVGSAGAKVFADAGCGTCHTLEGAKSAGTRGPNLDDLKPTADRVARQVRDGGAGMPSFRDKLSAEEIQDVADFVSVATRRATGGGSVAAVFEPDDTTIEECEAKEPDDRCYEQAFANIAYDQGPGAALDEFRRVGRQNRAVVVNCHQIAHMIGAGGLLHFEGDVSKAFVEGNPACGSGYYHGLLQWKLAGVRSSQVAAIAREVCDDPEIKANGFTYYQCDHGLGHGLMIYTGYDLPGALAFCHKLKTDFDQTSCTGGVFMENVSSSFGLRSKWLDEKNLLYPCNSKLVRGRDKLYCYLIIVQRILPAVDYDWKKTADWCRRSEPAWIDRCFESYGRSVASATHRQPDGMRTLCHRAGSGERRCISGAVIDVLNNNPSDRAAKALCDSVAPAFRGSCYRSIGFMLGTQHGDVAGKQGACREVATRAEDLAQCLRGAGL